MKVPASILLLVLVSNFLEHSSGALPDIGNCTYREYINELRVCTTAIFVNMRSDPKGPCSPKVLAFKDCIVEKDKQCNSSISLSKSDLPELKKLYCKNAGIFTAAFLKFKKKGEVPSGPCSSTYFQKGYECYNETLRLWRMNKADSRLCSVFCEAIKCIKTLIDAECNYTGVQKEIMDLKFDGYNPFCAPLHNTGSPSLDGESHPNKKNIRKILHHEA